MDREQRGSDLDWGEWRVFYRLGGVSRHPPVTSRPPKVAALGRCTGAPGVHFCPLEEPCIVKYPAIRNDVSKNTRTSSWRINNLSRPENKQHDSNNATPQPVSTPPGPLPSSSLSSLQTLANDIASSATIECSQRSRSFSSFEKVVYLPLSPPSALTHRS